MRPRFLSGFPSPWVHDPFFQLVSGFPNHVTSLSPRSLFSYWSAVSHSKTRDFRFRSWRHPYIKTRLSLPYGPTLLLSITFTSNANGKNTTWSWGSRPVLRLPFAVLNVKSTRVRLQREYFFEVFDSFCHNYQPVIKPSDVFFIFLLQLTGLLSLFKQKGRKKCEKASWCLVVTFAKAINCFMKNALRLCSTSKHPKETIFNW